MTKFYVRQWVKLNDKHDALGDPYPNGTLFKVKDVQYNNNSGRLELYIEDTCRPRESACPWDSAWFEPLPYQVGDTLVSSSGLFRDKITAIDSVNVHTFAFHISHSDYISENWSTEGQEAPGSTLDPVSTIDPDWVIGPFESIKQWQQVITALESQGEVWWKVYSFEQLWNNTNTRVIKRHRTAFDWHGTCKIPNISPAEVLEKLGTPVTMSPNLNAGYVGVHHDQPMDYAKVEGRWSSAPCECPHLFLDGHQQGCSFYKKPAVTPNVWGIKQPPETPTYETWADKETENNKDVQVVLG
jgi:hypothetical protein